jgi:hypothetical protein
VNSYIFSSRSNEDVSGVLETWRTEWLEQLEYGLSWDPSSLYLYQDINSVYPVCIKTFGSVDDILTMIEEGDQGKSLRPRVNAIRADVAGMQTLQELWEDKRQYKLVKDFLTSSKLRLAVK